MKIVRTVLEIYKRCVHGQTDKQTTPFFFKVGTYLDRFLVPKIYVIPNFVKIVRMVLGIYKSCAHGQIGRQTENPVFYKF